MENSNVKEFAKPAGAPAPNMAVPVENLLMAAFFDPADTDPAKPRRLHIMFGAALSSKDLSGEHVEKIFWAMRRELRKWAETNAPHLADL